MRLSAVALTLGLACPGVALAQGNDFNLPPPIFIIPTPFSVPGLTGLRLPQVINNEKKSAAEVAANDYDARGRGADAAASYWCSSGTDFFPSVGFIVCGYMAHVAASSRVYAEANRLIQRDPFDSHFNEPADPAYLEASQLGLWYMDASDPTAAYVNWLVDNTRAFYAWADMVRVTADRAGTCILLFGYSDCTRRQPRQLDRLWWGMQNMVDLQHELGNRIMPGIRDHLYGLGLQDEGDLVNGISWDATELARMLAE